MKAFVAALLMSAASARYSILRDQELLADISHIQDTIRSGGFAKKIMLFGQLATLFAGPKGQSINNQYDFDWGEGDLGLLSDNVHALENEWKQELAGKLSHHHENDYDYNNHVQFDNHMGTHWNWFIHEANRPEHDDGDESVLRALFDDYDTNDNGHLSKEEYSAMQDAINHYKTDYYYGYREKFWSLKSKYCDNSVFQEQSPIDVDTSTVDTNVDPASYEYLLGSQSPNVSFNVSYTNNRISMMAVNEAGAQDTQNIIFVHSEGDDDSQPGFLFDHVDLRFGSNNTEGSEHRIDGKQWPMEMQWVYYRDDFASLDDAVLNGKNLYESGEEDHHTVATFSVLFQIHEHELNNSYVNPSLNKILNGYRNDSVDETIELNLIDLLPNNMEEDASTGMFETTTSVYRYQGSMTTPDCYPIVNWFIMEDTVLVGEKQMNRLHELTDNARVFRDTQVNNNTVYELDETNSGGFKVTIIGADLEER